VTLFDHPIWGLVEPYAHLSLGRANVDFLQLPDQLRSLALDVVVNCVSCGALIHPMRERAPSSRSRVSRTAVERRLFYAASCTAERSPGCSRTVAAMRHKDEVRARLGRAA